MLVMTRAIPLVCIAILMVMPTDSTFAHTPHDSIAFLAVSPEFESDQTLFIGVLKQLQRSTDGGYSWKRLNSGLTNRGFIQDLAISPEFGRDKTVFLAAAGDGVYRSIDGGQTWVHLTKPERFNICRLRISQNFGSDSMLLAISDIGALFASMDAGDTWRELLGPNADVYDALTIQYGGTAMIVVTLGDGTALRLVGENEQWESVDGLAPQEAGAIISYIPGSKEILIAAADGSIYISNDRAASFRQISTIPNGLDGMGGRPTSIDFSRAAIGSVTTYVSTWHGGLFASRDNGNRWEAINAGLTKSTQADELNVPHFRSVKVGGDDVFLGGFDGLFYSDDSAEHWTQLETVAVDLPTSVSVSRGKSGVEDIYIATFDAGLYVGEKQGTEWKALNIGLQDKHHWSIRSHRAANGSSLVLSATNKSIYRLVDDGMPWEQIVLGCKAEKGVRSKFGKWINRRLVGYGLREKCRSSFPHGLVFTDNLENQGYVFFGTRYEGIFRSADRGRSWTQILDSNGRWVDTIAPTPQFQHSNTVFASIRGRGVFKSTNGGELWSRLPVPELDDWVGQYIHARLPLSVSPDFSNDGTIFVGSVNGLYISRDRGLKWSSVPVEAGLPSSIPVVALALSPTFSDDGYLLVSLQGAGLYGSNDKGETFVEIARDLTERNQKLQQIVFSGYFETNQTVFGISEEESLVSKDRGKSWSTLKSPIID